jgi:hypothetical protein
MRIRTTRGYERHGIERIYHAKSKYLCW